MLTKAEIKLIKSLSIKKYRDIHKLFLVEGEKIIAELLESELDIEYLIKNDADIKKISNFNSIPTIIAVVKTPHNILNINNLQDKLTLAIDTIQDPGNLGTIIRICDWFGIKNLILSKNSVDLYNPKVVQATMGAFLRVNVFYVNLEQFICEYKKQTENIVYGAFLYGENIYEIEKTHNALIVMGNEGNGISQLIKNQIDTKIFIPPFNSTNHSESLNISVATAIVCNEFRRNHS
jgi:TrmH family RNA methyltransferase